MRRGSRCLQMKTSQVLRVANYRKGHSSDRWRSRLLSVSIGAVRTHLVPRAEHLHLEVHYYHDFHKYSNLRTHCAGSCSGKMAVFDMSFDLENR